MSVMDKTPQTRGEPVMQVMEVRMHAGERFDRILYAICRYYFDAFLCGERQVGMPILRRMYDEYEYRFLYFNRDEVRANRQISHALGHHRSGDDVPFRNFRLGVANRELVIRSKTTLEQMRRLAWRAKNEEDERKEDRQLKASLEGGGSPDCVMCNVYAFHAINEIVHFDPPKPGYAPNTYGALFGHEELEGDPNPKPLSYR